MIREGTILPLRSKSPKVQSLHFKGRNTKYMVATGKLERVLRTQLVLSPTSLEVFFFSVYAISMEVLAKQK